MFQFPTFASLVNQRSLAFNQGGCPIRISVDQCIFATPHRFSQLITSFIASESLGIPHTPLLTFFQHSVYTSNHSPAYLLLFAFSLLSCFSYHHVNELLRLPDPSPQHLVLPRSISRRCCIYPTSRCIAYRIVLFVCCLCGE